MCLFLVLEIFSNSNIVNLNINHNFEVVNFKTIEEKLEIEIKKQNKWEIKIPKINLNAQISEGTTNEVMDYYVGHFEETPKENGNVCLAAHNRGYRVNYFEKIKELEKGDLIYYEYKNNKKIFEVQEQTIIEETDWTKLENTDENKITLITCVENMPEYRRCIVGKEMEEIYD